MALGGYIVAGPEIHPRSDLQSRRPQPVPYIREVRRVLCAGWDDAGAADGIETRSTGRATASENQAVHGFTRRRRSGLFSPPLHHSMSSERSRFNPRGHHLPRRAFSAVPCAMRGGEKVRRGGFTAKNN